MKTTLIILFALVSLTMSAQVANYKANSLNLLQSFQSGEISKEAYIDYGLLKEYVIDASPSKGDLYAGIGGAGLAVVSYSVDLEKIFKKRR